MNLGDAGAVAVWQGGTAPTAKIRVIPNGFIKKRGTTGSKDADQAYSLGLSHRFR